MIFSKINTTLILSFSVLLTASISNVFAAGKLCFSCNDARAITAASAQGGMTFDKPQEDFEGLDIASVLDLDPDTEKKIIEAFAIAIDINDTVEISYIYKTITFNAEITPLNSLVSGPSYFVKVTQN